jgi:ribose transport system substrate-binding protein
LVIIIAFVLFITWYSKYEIEAAYQTSSINSRYQIYLITMDKQDQFWLPLNQGASDMAEFLGVTYVWNAPETKDSEEQIRILNEAVEDGADAILIAAIDPVRMSGPIEDAKAEGVKIIYVDSPAYEEAITTLSTDNYGAGVKAAESMLLELSELGIQSGTIGIIGVNTATDSTMKRETGFREKIISDGRFLLLETDYRNGDPTASQEAATILMEDNPGLVGIFGTNEGSSIGVGNAIKAANKSIIGIGFDRTDAMLGLIRDGSLKAVIVQNPYTMGYLGLAQAMAALNGYDTGPINLDTGVSIIKKR